MEQEQDIVTSEQNSLATIIQLAVEKGDLDKVEKLLALKERYEASEARKAYHKAMTSFKANPPEINKDKKVGYKTSGGQVGYSHASLFNVTEKINKELSKHGLSASWTTKQNGGILVTCKITHIQGHSEETTLLAQPDASGSKNAIQAMGSTITYLERYTLLALTGLATHEDDDGKASEVEYISEAEGNKILDMITGMGGDLSKFLTYMKIGSLEKMPKSDYKKAISAIEQTMKIKKAGKK